MLLLPTKIFFTRPAGTCATLWVLKMQGNVWLTDEFCVRRNRRNPPPVHLDEIEIIKELTEQPLCILVMLVRDLEWRGVAKPYTDRQNPYSVCRFVFMRDRRIRIWKSLGQFLSFDWRMYRHITAATQLRLKDSAWSPCGECTVEERPGLRICLDSKLCRSLYYVTTIDRFVGSDVPNHVPILQSISAEWTP
jgi:hypothetical protein